MNSRRTTPIVAFIPEVDGRESSVGRPRPSSRPSTLGARHSGNKRAGMTMIELCVVMGIVTVLMAMVVGLSRHVSEIVKIRRAQADLGAWHEAFNQWYLQFGEYPYGNPLNNNLLSAATPTRNLRSILDACYVTVGSSNIYFRALTQGYASRTNDPWGSPYIYDCDPGRKSYLLYSCGPDSRSVLSGHGIPDQNTPAFTRDDVYFER